VTCASDEMPREGRARIEERQAGEGSARDGSDAIRRMTLIETTVDSRCGLLSIVSDFVPARRARYGQVTRLDSSAGHGSRATVPGRPSIHLSAHSDAGDQRPSLDSGAPQSALIAPLRSPPDHGYYDIEFSSKHTGRELSS